MHLRGTHCVLSDGKNQISRAQCRVKSGTVRDEARLSVEETIAGVGVGRVQASTLGITVVKSIAALAETGAAGTGTAVGADCSTQQQAFLAVQQPH